MRRRLTLCVLAAGTALAACGSGQGGGPGPGGLAADAGGQLPPEGRDASAARDAGEITGDAGFVPLVSILIAEAQGASTTIPDPVTLPVAYTPPDATNKHLDWVVCSDEPIHPSGAPPGLRTCTVTGSLGSVTSGGPGVGGIYTPPSGLAASPTGVRLIACQDVICDWTIVTVTVPGTPGDVVINSFRASPASLSEGASATLSWSAANATSLSISASAGAAPGAVTGTSVNVTPTCSPLPCSVVYTLTAEGRGGPATATAAVSVSRAGSRVYPPETTLMQYPQPPASEPALGQTMVNTFGSLGPSYDTLTLHASDLRHHYSKDSPWNTDESFAVTNSGQLLDGTTYAPLRSLSFPNEHKTWSNTDPRCIYGANKAQRQWVRLDATTGTTTVLATFSQFTSVSYGLYEGNMDNADTGAALVGSGTTPFLIDPKTGGLRCTVTGGGGFDGTRAVSDATMSQDGQWMLVHWSGYGVDAYRASDCGFHRKLTTRTGHYDACVSQAGEQVYVNESGTMIRISDGADLGLQWDDGSRAHVSCRNIRRPGWIYVSTENTTCDTTLKGMKKFQRIFAAKLDGSQRIENYAWDHQGCPSTYDTLPMVAPSPWGDRVWWKGDWDATAGALHSFVSWKP